MPGGFNRVLRRLQSQTVAGGKFDWDLRFVDATVVRAYQHTAGV